MGAGAKKLGAMAVVLSVLAAVVGGCHSAPPGQAPPAAQSSLSDVPPPLVPAMDLPANAVDNAVSKLDDMADELMKKSGIPGMAVAVVHGGKTVYAKGFGVKDVRSGDKVDPYTVFQLASVSKSLGSTVVAHQVSQNAIGWDTPLVSKLPWFALSNPVVTQMVNVGDMYSHRSGLPDVAGDILEDLGYDRQYVLQRLRQLPLAPFRISYAYTNFGLTAAAEAVAVGAGKSWEDLSDEVLYQPLGMTSTSSRFADYQARPNRAIGHIQIDGRYEPRFVRDPDAEAPAGGVSSSVNDMTHWLAMVLANGSYNGRQITDPKALLPALTPQMVSSPPTEPAMRAGFYGYGFNVGSTSAARMEFSHSGGFRLGAATNFVIIPSADVAIVALTNATPLGVPEALTAQFADLVQFGQVREDWYKLYGALFGSMEKPVGSLVGEQPPGNPAPAAPLSSYVGRYNNDYWGPATVSERDGKLALTLGPRGDTVDLTHWDGDVFTFQLITEDAPPGTISKATFAGNKLTLEYYDADKMGTFTQ
jgi:CubicO group peptidase (beta-lactamase class C family)